MSNELKISRKVIFLSDQPISLPVAAADPGSAADGDMYYNSTSDQIKIFAGGSWASIQAGSSITSGIAGQIPVYGTTGTSLNPTYVQNLQNINLQYEAQPTRSTGLIYTLPNPGDAVSTANIIISSGATSNTAVLNKVLTGFVSGFGTVAATDTILQAINKLDGNDGLRVLKAGDSMTGNLLFADNLGILNSAAVSTLNIGTNGNTSTINIGSGTTTVNILGTLSYIQSTNTQITDSLVTLNKGGAAASGGNSGLEVEENSLITGSAKVSSARLSWDLKAPASLGTSRLTTPTTAFTGTLDFGAPSADRTWTLPNATGNLALITGAITEAANAALSNLSSVAINTGLLPATTNSIDIGSSSFRWANLHSTASKLYGITTGNISIQAADSTTTYSVKMPAAQGATDTFLFNDGSGNLSWSTIAQSALIRVRLYDPVSTALATGTIIIDDETVMADDLVLFSALLSGNNRVYKAVGTGSTITSWTVQNIFAGSNDPENGETAIIQEGAAFATQIGKFNGTTWTFNDKVRYFNGTDYWEESAIVTSTLTDNTTDNVFTVGFAGSEYTVIDYSINRGITRETGTIYIVTDGAIANVTTSGAYIGRTGVTFSGDISGLLLRLRYTTTSTGSNATMKYTVKRWSNGAGGPGGPPNYTGFSGSLATAGGSDGDIQYNNLGTIDGDANFKIDTVNASINLNGLRLAALSSGTTLIDNTASPALLLSLNAASYKHMVIEYSITRNTEARTGRILVSNNGTLTGFSDDYVESGVTGVTFSSDVSGGNVRIFYVTTSTGFNATFKYSMRRWS